VELSQITPTIALYYSFHTSSTIPVPLSTTSPSQALQPITLLGPAAALSELLETGCTLATKPWVDNHWALVLWKLAGMVCLDPERESDGREKRWCWGEVMRQLLYRSIFLKQLHLFPMHCTDHVLSFADMNES
jgi:breast cancer 2 susceptibility protein